MYSYDTGSNRTGFTLTKNGTVLQSTYEYDNLNRLAKYRQALVDTFVNRIYLYDDKMTILYHSQDSHSDVDIDPDGLSGVMLVERIDPNTNINYMSTGFAIIMTL